MKVPEFNVPILFVVFNRVDTARQVFKRIALVKPSKLYIASDGPRKAKSGEAEKVDEVRSYILNSIDWDCEVRTLFRNSNLGCKLAVSSAVDWFFGNEEAGIILEDDCLPDVSFFSYCEELLSRYKDDTRIMHIGGTNIQNNQIRGDGTYYYSKTCHVWGWATWRRAWEKYDLNMSTYEKFRDGGLIASLFHNKTHIKYWISCFERTYLGKIDTWDYQWVYTVWTNSGLCVVPQVNLISNIGFGHSATHTIDENNYFANRPSSPMNTIEYPTIMMQDKAADLFSMQLFLAKPSIENRIKRKAHTVFNKVSTLVKALVSLM